MTTMKTNRPNQNIRPPQSAWMEPVEGRLLMSADLAASETTTPMETCSFNYAKVESLYQRQTQHSSGDPPTETLSLNFTRL